MLWRLRTGAPDDAAGRRYLLPGHSLGTRLRPERPMEPTAEILPLFDEKPSQPVADLTIDGKWIDLP
ncbi:hypothetical protein SAMN06272735_8451 [Streptomyces sp. TLI_55]|nr:hypothetical protein SAMN06272735_8451 [Streptomyces sp. TLI_55]